MKNAFFPNADALFLSAPAPERQPVPPRPQSLGPIYDPDNLDLALDAWNAKVESRVFPPKEDPFASSTIPEEPSSPSPSSRYVRANLAKHERLRLSMLWYYTHDLQNQPEFLSGLQEKACLAQESSGWEFAVIGILDLNVYIRLATVGLQLAILPRGETLCAHTVCAPPGNVFLLPNMMEDWRFRQCPYVEQGGLTAYAGVPLRMQHESGESVGLGSLCVASKTSQEPLSKSQQQTLARLGDWIVADMVQSTRTRRQRERQRFANLLSTLQQDTTTGSDEAVLQTLKKAFPNDMVRIQSSRKDPVRLDESDLAVSPDSENGVWEDTAYIDEIIANDNQYDPPEDKVIRFISAHCQSKLGDSLLVIATSDFRRMFDDVDLWFVQACAAVITRRWQDLLMSEVMVVKERFLRGMSHRLRTPIHGILGAAELRMEDVKKLSLRQERDHAERSERANLLDAFANCGDSTNYLSTISSAGQELMATVNSVITLHRWADVAHADRQYSFCGVAELEDELIKGLHTVTSNGLHTKTSVFFHCNLGSSVDTVRVDLNLLRDSVLPLIHNAIQNTPEGIVTVTVSMKESSKTLTFDVEDNGCGIAEQDQQRIFELYEKVGEYSTGAGLGLSLARKFSALLDGSVELVSSEPGRGSHFRAAFQDIDYQSSPSSLRPRTHKPRQLPQQFYYNSSGPKTFLETNLIAVLASQGFSRSDTPEQCLQVIPYENDVDRRRQRLARLPLDQVAICAIPATEEKKPNEAESNVVYVESPFSTKKLSDALQEAEKLYAALQASKPSEPTDSSCGSLAKDDTGEGSTPYDEDYTSVDSSTTESPQASTDFRESNISTVASEVCADDTTDLTLAPLSLGRSTSTKPTVLLVDDNVINLRIMQMYCKKRGMPYFSAADGQQAVATFTKQQALAASGSGSPIELVLMDLQMPVCDGIEATTQIRQLEKDKGWNPTVLLIVTGQDSQTDREAASGASADDFLVKPVGMSFLDKCLMRFFPALNVL